MKILIVLALSFFAHAGSFNISLVNEADSGIVRSIRSTSAIVALPACRFSRQRVTVNVTNSTGGPGPEQESFVRPICRFRRGLVSIVSTINGARQTFDLGYRLKNLKADTEYRVVYQIDGEESNPLSFRTTSPTDLNDIDAGFSGRSGAMVVITVLLVIAMAMLIVLLIVSIMVRS
ncbi:uroplakin-2-like [Stegostoma tigrinum]|uniref:uroplakin-2-like n=1 Tax=Stegostoma tigrinum TaxID=3053191 RepID=UPI0028703C49|nr:uroplakin-2-like [Stegostoma tigrinum]